MVKAVFFDIDGTLISHQDGRVPASAEESVYQLKEKGMKLFAATGRHMLELEKLPVSGLPFDGYVTLNGQICLDSEGSVICGSAIDSGDTETIVSSFERMEAPILIIELERMYINFVNQMVDIAQKAISTPVPETGAYAGGRIYQAIVFEKEAYVQSLIGRLPNCKMSRWNRYGFDVIPENGGKVAGIRRILQHFHIDQSEIMAFGDGENDREMLRYAGTGIAMGNADTVVKQHADYVTSDVDQDGIRRALEFYGVL